MDFLEIFQSEMVRGIVAAFAGAFFAFIFFVVGQLWISSNKKRSETISDLQLIKNEIVFQIQIFKMNQEIVKNIIEADQSITIFIKKFHSFSYDDNWYHKLDNYKVSEDILSFVVRIKILNEDIESLNRHMNELSEFSKVAMLEKREDDFKVTMDKNLSELKSNSKKLISSMNDAESKIDTIVDGIEFSLWYVNLYFWQKAYFLFRHKINSNYRNEVIKRMTKDYYENKKSKN